MKPIFCGNFEYDARQSDLERLFRRYGKVDRVDMKSGFAFVYMEDERDAKDAIRALDHTEFGRKGRRLRVEWTKQERSSRQPESSRKSPSKTRPSKTLFVINFDPHHTRTRDLERHFDPYGKILNIRIRRNFAFIQFESQEDAAKALDATNMSKLLDRIITVEFAIKDDDERRNGNSPDRVHNRSPRRGHERVRSQSPYRRERDSPDYGQGGRGRSPSPHRRARASPDYVRRSRGSPNRKERGSPDRKERDRCLSPSPKKERESDRNHKRNSSPQTKWSDGDGDASNGLNPVKRASPDYSHRSPSPSPQREEGETTYSENDAYTRSPAHSDEESPPPDRYGSRSPLARERSRS